MASIPPAIWLQRIATRSVREANAAVRTFFIWGFYTIKGDMSSESEDRLPWQATRSAAAYEGIDRLPVSIVLENVRSMYNVGSFFRTADAAGAAKLCLCGITAHPPKHAISKTALGAEEVVPWEHTWDAAALVRGLRVQGCEIAAIETSVHAVDLFDWRPVFPVAVIFGHETDGLTAELSGLADTHVRIPMLGKKHSLNVATAGGVVLFELLRKYRLLMRGEGSAMAPGGL
jgi:23S rRNA (guanosine2251-2'-O)-methyltransferase